MEVIYDQNDTLLKVVGLYNNHPSNLGYVNNATVTCERVVDDAGNTVTGQNWPLTLSYIADSDGLYVGTLSYALEGTPKREYKAVIDVEVAGVQVAHWEPVLLWKIRR